MKKKLLINLLSIVAILMFWQPALAQNLLVNGDMESWTDATTINGWTHVENITQESTIVHGGNYSAKQIGGTKDLGQTIDVTTGAIYDFSLWYYVAAGDGTDARIWCVWKDNTGASIYDNTDEIRGPNGAYLTSDASWQNYTTIVTAPANAVQLYFEVRTYSGATVYWDDFSVEEAGGGSDTLAPSWSTGYPMVLHVEDTRAGLAVKMDESGTAYYVVVPAGSDAPTSDQVKAGIDYGSVTVGTSGNIEVTSPELPFTADLTGATASTSYDIYVVAEDGSGNLQAEPVKVSIVTTAARALTVTSPSAGTSFNLGDSATITWTSANIDSLMLSVYSYNQGTAFPIERSIAASTGRYTFYIPHEADTGNYDFILSDVYDTSFKAKAGPISLADNRELKWVKPQNGDTVYVGDTLTMQWTSNNIDSVLIGGYIAQGGPEGGYFMLTGDVDHDDPAHWKPVAASAGTFKFYLDPKGMGGSVTIDSMFLYDASDTSFKDVVYPVYIQDTFPMMVRNTVPYFGMTDFPATSNISCNFNSDSIVPGTGQLHLKRADGTTVEDVNVSALQFWSDGFSFMPNPALVPGESYYIEMDAGLVKSADGTKTFGGLTGKDWSFTVASSTLYFSEYIEGSSNNKALEIYNPTNHDINLDDYIIAGSGNGGGINQDADVYHFPQGTVLKSGEVFVLANSGASSDILKVTNDTLEWNEGGFVVSFNGNDARALIRIVNNGNDWLWIDQIGNPWEDPGHNSGWDVAGVTAATKDHTLLRKASVMMGTTNWGRSSGSDAESSEWIVEPKDTFDNLGLPTPAGSGQAEILGVVLKNANMDDVTIHTTIDSQKDSITVEVLAGTDVTNMYGDFNISDGAEIHPSSTDMLDFTNPLQFTVTAENGLNSKVWTIKVTVAAAQSSEADIQDFNIPGMIGDEVIDWTQHTVDILMPYGTDMTALTPIIEISTGATISPESGIAQDFTNLVVYTVTAQDGTTIDWTVGVKAEVANAVKIKDIQYTEDASGDSPLKGQLVKTYGIVTATNIYNSTFNGYFIQDSIGAWNGIYVYDPVNTTITIGDSVEIVGMVDEYNNFTEIKNVASVTVFNSDNTLPGPVVVSTGDSFDEQWESVFMQFKDATCTKTDRGHNEMEVNDGTGMAVVDDYLFAYDPFVLNDVYTITGVMNFSYSEFKLDPRSADDITDVTGINNISLSDQVKLYPNPGNGIFNINLNGTLKGEINVKVIDITGRVVFEKSYSQPSSVITVNISNEVSNLYFITLSNANHTLVKKFMKR